jgi:hypothetical protein
VAAKRSTENTKAKQDFVAKRVKQSPSASMNSIGVEVQKEFGSKLAYNKLREAFIGAGGQVDTSRTKKKGKAKAAPKAKAAAKGKRRGGRGTGETTKAKQEFVVQYLKSNPGCTMNQAGVAVTQKFGTQLGFDKLKEAFLGAGGKVGKPGRKGAPRARVATRKAGRRSSDVAAARATATLKDMPTHVVVMHLHNNVETTEFNTKSQAEEFARKQLMAGIPAAKIAYYTRQPLQVSLGI